METRKRVAYPLGMFDLFKGLGMISIIFVHTAMGDNAFYWLFVPIHVLTGGLMGAYYAINGFQFRRTASVKKSIKKHAKAYLPMYFRLAVAVLLCQLLMDPGVIMQQMLGFLLGTLNPIQFGPYYFMSVSMGWFFLALFWSSILLDLILRMRREAVRVACITALTILGVYLESVSFGYYCICRGFQALPAMYIGYCIFNRTLLNEWVEPVQKAMPYVMYVVSLPILYMYTVGTAGFWNTFILVVSETIWAYVIIFISRDTVGFDNGLVSLFCKVGRYTPWIMIVHSAEMQAIDWEILLDHLGVTGNVRFLVQLLLRGILIFAGCILMNKIDRMEKNWKRSRRKREKQRKMMG